MSRRPLISVVVPFFNSEAHLAACIESLQSQEGVAEAYEIILIDNGSSDGSVAIARGFDGIELLTEAKTGAYAARNTGIRAASGSLIALTDADCVVDPDWLRAIVQGMEDPSVAILVGYCAYPSHASSALKLLAAYENAKAEYVLGRCPPAYQFAYANNMAVRRSVFDELGPFEEWPRAADSELVHRLAARRPDLRAVFHPAMRVTHLEFLRARDRTRRLSLYTRTNSQIATFRELGPRQRLGLLWLLLRRLALG
jgi:glycosyltransferase involved in cell wall biosynthesis